MCEIEDRMMNLVIQKDMALFAVAEAKETDDPLRVEKALREFRIAEEAYEAWKPIYLKIQNQNQFIKNTVRNERAARARYERGIL